MLGQRTIANEVMVDIDEGTPKPVEPVGSDVQEDSVEVEDFADTSNDESHDDGPIALRKPKRNTRKPAKFNDMAAYALPVVSEDIPLSYLEARHSSEVTHWIGAMQEEMDSLSKNQTWDLVELPIGKKAVGCKWVFAKKDGISSEDKVRYKARLVAKGFAQREGIDYNEVFSPVVKHSSIRILLALVAQWDLELAQLDVKTGFLHGNLEKKIYMTQPEGFQTVGKENWVCKLKKSLYGLKQSPRQWYKRFDQFMVEQGFNRSSYDHCVYFRKLGEGINIYLLLLLMIC